MPLLHWLHPSLHDYIALLGAAILLVASCCWRHWATFWMGGRCLVIALWPGRCGGLLPTCVYRCAAFFVIWRDKLSGWSALCLDGIRGNCCLVRDGIRWNMFWLDAKM